MRPFDNDPEPIEEPEDCQDYNDEHTDKDHPFLAPSADDSRSPCPALNTLANHHYLPHDGQRISPIQLVKALRKKFHLSYPLASLLSLTAVLLCGHRGHIDLADLAAHNVIEHDNSLVHDDAAPGASFAPVSVNPTLVQRLLDVAKDQHGFTLEDFARARQQRQRDNLSKKLDRLHMEIACGESSLTWLVLKDEDGEIDVHELWSWFQEERFSDEYVRPAQSISLRQARAYSSRVRALLEEATPDQ